MEENNKTKAKGTNSIGEKILKDVKTWLLVAVVLVFSIVVIVKETNKTGYSSNNGLSSAKTYKVKINIDFISNLIFSTYDVKVKMADYSKVMNHGEDHSFELNLKEGIYDLIFVKDSDSSISETVKIDVHSNMEIGYKISCYYNRIDVKEQYRDLDEKIEENKIKIDFNKDSFTVKDKDEVIKKLKDYGFTNIKENPLYDIVFGLTSEGETEEVTIGGKTDYKRGDIFDNDVEIVVTYHLKEDDDPNRVRIPYSNAKAEEKNYKDVEKDYRNAGFTNIKTEVQKTSFESLDEKVSQVLIGLLAANTSEKYKTDEKVTIKYYKYEKQEETKKEEEKKEETTKEDTKKEEKDEYASGKMQMWAQNSLTNAAKQVYPYGVNLHWANSLNTNKYQGNGIWYFKIKATVKNQYGTERECFISAKVDMKKEIITDFKETKN